MITVPVVRAITRNAVRSILHGLEGDNTPVIPPALTGITELWVYDASIGFGICNSTALGNEMVIGTDYFATEHGLTLKVVNKSVGGQQLSAITSRWEAEKSAVTGRADIIVMSMPIGNTISGRWDAKSQAAKDQLVADYAAFANSVIANGNTFMPVNTTWRNVSPESLIDEANGSDPYNQGMIWPVAKSMSPNMWYNGKPYADWYEFIRRWFSMLADDRHPTDPWGYGMLRSWAFDMVAARIKGLAPPPVTRYPDPTAFQTQTLQRAMVVCINLTAWAKSSTIYWATAMGNAATGTYKGIAMEGYLPNSMTFQAPGANLTGGTNTNVFNTGNKTKTLLHDGIKNNWVYVTLTTFTEMFRIVGLTPGQQVRIDFVAMRQATGDTRRGEYTVNGGTSFIEANATYAVGQTPTVNTLTGTADASGNIIFMGRCKTGSTFCFLNGFIATPI